MRPSLDEIGKQMMRRRGPYIPVDSVRGYRQELAKTVATETIKDADPTPEPTPSYVEANAIGNINDINLEVDTMKYGGGKNPKPVEPTGKYEEANQIAIINQAAESVTTAKTGTGGIYKSGEGSDEISDAELRHALKVLSAAGINPTGFGIHPTGEGYCEGGFPALLAIAAPLLAPIVGKFVQSLVKRGREKHEEMKKEKLFKPRGSGLPTKPPNDLKAILATRLSTPALMRDFPMLGELDDDIRGAGSIKDFFKKIWRGLKIIGPVIGKSLLDVAPDVAKGLVDVFVKYKLGDKGSSTGSTSKASAVIESLAAFPRGISSADDESLDRIRASFAKELAESKGEFAPDPELVVHAERELRRMRAERGLAEADRKAKEQKSEQDREWLADDIAEGRPSEERGTVSGRQAGYVT